VRTDVTHDPPQTLDTCSVRKVAPVTVPSIGVEVGF